MNTLQFDLTQVGKPFKPMNAVNNGPCHKRGAVSQNKSNLAAYKAARIPYARNHDAAFWAAYGGEHSVDITGIFPDFEADAYDPKSYDFKVTDEYVLVTLDAGTKTFYRLGQKIEHYVKKFGTVPPKDFKKWAVICEHIIRHYTEGWADGFYYDMPYWEIWNEADLSAPDDNPNKPTWGGTKQQFFDFYEIAAKHLKECFPHLKIGGPALAHNEAWAADFLKTMSERRVPIDFFSWHIYCTTPEVMVEKGTRIRRLMEAHGYGQAESILDEWNYVKGWRDKEFLYSIETIIGVKGAAFTLACMSAGQASDIDMLMYYDARPCAFNGLFDFYTLRPLKTYYALQWYGMLYDLTGEVQPTVQIADIYSLCGCDKNGKVMAVLTYYSDEDNKEDKIFTVDFGREGEYEIYLLDGNRDGDLLEVRGELHLNMQVNTCVLIKER